MAYGSDRANPYRIRLGIDVPRARGVNTEVDPAALPPDQFRRLENVDFFGNRIINCKGLAKVNSSSAMTGSVMGIADDRAMGIGGGAAAGIDGRLYVTGASDVGVACYDPMLNTSTELFATSPYVGAPNESTAIFFDALEGYVYLSRDSGKVWRFRPGVVKSPAGTVAASQATPEHVLTFPNVMSPLSLFVTSMVRIGSLLYIATCTTSNGYVYSFDGKTLTEVDTFSMSDAVVVLTYLTKYRDRPVVFYCPSDNTSTVLPTVRYRADTGTWTAMTFPGSSGVELTQACEYKDKLFISGHLDDTANEGKIWQVSGTTITQVRSIANCQNSGIEGIATDGAYLYYSYGTSVDNNRYLGRYDNSSFSDTYATIDTSLSAAGSGQLSFQGKYLYAITENGGGTVTLYRAVTPYTSFSLAATLGLTSYNVNTVSLQRVVAV
jgi:hypothetical protein